MEETAGEWCSRTNCVDGGRVRKKRNQYGAEICRETIWRGKNIKVKKNTTVTGEKKHITQIQHAKYTVTEPRVPLSPAVRGFAQARIQGTVSGVLAGCSPKETRSGTAVPVAG
eukprot:6926821-Prymnesium_polylepis.1